MGPVEPASRQVLQRQRPDQSQPRSFLAVGARSIESRVCAAHLEHLVFQAPPAFHSPTTAVSARDLRVFRIAAVHLPGAGGRSGMQHPRTISKISTRKSALASSDASSRFVWNTGVFYSHLNENIPRISSTALRGEIINYSTAAYGLPRLIFARRRSIAPTARSSTDRWIALSTSRSLRSARPLSNSPILSKRRSGCACPRSTSPAPPSPAAHSGRPNSGPSESCRRNR